MALDLRAGIWRLVDPKISLASIAAMALGAGAAAHDGPLAWGWLALTVLGILAIEAAKNASGEIVDFDSGTDLAVAPEDRSPFSGGKRVLVDGLLTRRQTTAIAGICYAIGVAVGLGIVAGRAPGVLGIGAVGVALAFFYHAPPLRLSYRGLGEVAVGICYGPLIAVGTYLVQRGRIAPAILLASLPLALLIVAFLWLAEFPDYRADLAAGKRNLVVRLGRRRAARVFPGLIVLAFAGAAALPWLGVPRGIWAGAIGFPFGVAAAWRVLADPENTARLVLAQVLTLGCFVTYAVGAAIGLAAGG